MTSLYHPAKSCERGVTFFSCFSAIVERPPLCGRCLQIKRAARAIPYRGGRARPGQDCGVARDAESHSRLEQTNQGLSDENSCRAATPVDPSTRVCEGSADRREHSGSDYRG